MGSGHFLVAAANEITSWAISLLHENPDAPLIAQVEEDRRQILEEQAKRGIVLDAEQLTDAVILKRMVMKRCVFGVDINSMAVELAKLSLWLESFTIGSPLTFLDHHMRCGDSLMGLWRDKPSREPDQAAAVYGRTGSCRKSPLSRREPVARPFLGGAEPQPGGLRASPSDDKAPGGAAGFAGILSP